MGLSRARQRHQQSRTTDAPAEPSSTAAPRFRIVTPGEGGEAPPDRPLPADVVPDDALLAAIVAGETAALGALYDRHGRVVFALLVRIVRVHDTAEDLLQEVFLRVWQQAHVFDETRGSVRSWLHSIAHNLALNELRRLQRRPQVNTPAATSDGDGNDVYEGFVDPASDPAADACCAVRDAQMARVLAQLPPSQREVLTLYAAGFSQSEIAARLGEPLGTIKSRMRRALCHLRDALPAAGVDASWHVD
jgi:RNA polymerase sigma-70 factor (ECF subfamily)